MTSKIAPTDIISAELVFKDYVTFKENKVYLSEDVPVHIAEFFKVIMPDFVLIIYEMFNPVCPYCGSKLHRHEIKNWEINKKNKCIQTKIQMHQQFMLKNNNNGITKYC